MDNKNKDSKNLTMIGVTLINKHHPLNLKWAYSDHLQSFFSF